MNGHLYLRFIYILLVLPICIKMEYYNVDNKLPKNTNAEVFIFNPFITW